MPGEKPIQVEVKNLCDRYSDVDGQPAPARTAFDPAYGPVREPGFIFELGLRHPVRRAEESNIRSNEPRGNSELRSLAPVMGNQVRVYGVGFLVSGEGHRAQSLHLPGVRELYGRAGASQ